MLSQNRLKQLLHYNPDTGIFTRLSITSNCVKFGDIAGCLRNGYIRISVENKRYQAHRLAWLYMMGEWPKHQIDHVDHVRNNNQWANLREASNRENCKNRSIHSNNTSGCTGVSWNKSINKWVSYIRAEGDIVHLGVFDEIDNAILARKAANIKYGYHNNHGQKHKP